MIKFTIERRAFALTPLVLALAACSGSNDSSGTDPIPSADGGGTTDPGADPALPDVPSATLDTPIFDAALFDDDSATIDNPFLPLAPGTTAILRGSDEDGASIEVVTVVSHQKREIAGVESRIVIDREYEDGELVEETFDWFAQDRDGNVWYLGEASTEYEDGQPISTAGSWETGVDLEGTGTLGRGSVLMFDEPRVGQRYAQENYPGVAEDLAEVVALDAEVVLVDGTTATALQVLETNPLDAEAVDEYKYYVEGTGLVLEEKLDDSERLELVESLDQRTPDIDRADFPTSTVIDHPFHPLVPGQLRTYTVETDEGREDIAVEVLAEVRTVMGIPSVVVRDTVTLDGVLIEDTYDWFAQDADGNVWYMGEEVVNYRYDDAGTLISTDDAGSWEAGVDGAQPGFQMLASPRVGDSYFQEFLVGEAEDIAEVVALDETITLADGSVYTTLKTLEWNPLDDDSEELKYYAEGIGLVRESDVDGEELVDLVQGVR